MGGRGNAEDSDFTHLRSQKDVTPAKGRDRMARNTVHLSNKPVFKRQATYILEMSSQA